MSSILRQKIMLGCGTRDGPPTRTLACMRRTLPNCPSPSSLRKVSWVRSYPQSWERWQWTTKKQKEDAAKVIMRTLKSLSHYRMGLNILLSTHILIASFVVGGEVNGRSHDAEFRAKGDRLPSSTMYGPHRTLSLRFLTNAERKQNTLVSSRASAGRNFKRFLIQFIPVMQLCH